MAAYDDLQADVAAWMNRTDLGPKIPSFVRIAESRINLDVRSWQMIVSVTLTQPDDSNLIPLPADWLEWDKLAIDGRTLEYVRADVMGEYLRDGSTTADIRSYTMVGGYLIVGNTSPDPSVYPPVQVKATYYARIPALDSAPGGSTWLWDSVPAIYLYASLVSACVYVKDDGRANEYSKAYQALVADINSVAVKAPLSGSTWRQRAGVGVV